MIILTKFTLWFPPLEFEGMSRQSEAATHLISCVLRFVCDHIICGICVFLSENVTFVESLEQTLAMLSGAFPKHVLYPCGAMEL